MCIEVRKSRNATVIRDFWKIPGSESVPISMRNEKLVIFWDDHEQILRPILKFYMDFLREPRLFVDISWINYTLVDGEIYPIDAAKMMQLLRNESEINEATIWAETNEIEKILELCYDIPKVNLDLKQPENLETNLKNLKNLKNLRPFQSKSVVLSSETWLRMEDFLEIFINCLQVSMDTREFSDEDLVKFFKKWMGGVEMKQFEAAYPGDSVKEIMEKLDGAVEVRKASIEEKIQKFRRETCFVIENVHGTKAIVYLDKRLIHLTIDFNLITDDVTTDGTK